MKMVWTLLPMSSMASSCLSSVLVFFRKLSPTEGNRFDVYHFSFLVTSGVMEVSLIVARHVTIKRKRRNIQYTGNILMIVFEGFPSLAIGPSGN